MYEEASSVCLIPFSSVFLLFATQAIAYSSCSKLVIWNYALTLTKSFCQSLLSVS